MALLISVTYLDGYGRTTTRRVGTVSTTLTAAAADAAALIDAMADVSDLGTVKFSIEETTGAEAAAGEGSNLDVGATLTVTLSNTKKFPFRVPGIKAAKLNADGTVKVDDADILTLIGLFDAEAHLRVSEGDSIVNVLHGTLDK
jgi:hypothetical protein